MSDLELTSFQRVAEARIREIAKRTGSGDLSERTVMRGQMPHMAGEETAVKLRFDGIEVWLYEDEATFSRGGIDRRFERPDYATEAELVEALAGALISTVDSG